MSKLEEIREAYLKEKRDDLKELREEMQRMADEDDALPKIDHLEEYVDRYEMGINEGLVQRRW